MATTVRFYLDDQLVGTQTVDFQTGQPLATVRASQQVTLGGLTGELSADWTVEEYSESSEFWDTLTYSITESVFHGAVIDDEKTRWHYIWKSWRDGELIQDDEGWEYGHEIWVWPYFLRINWDDYEKTVERLKDLTAVDEIELHYTSCRVNYYSDDSLEVLLSSGPIIEGTPYSLAAAPARPSPNLAFAGWKAVANEDSEDEGPGVASPWPWNPGDQIDFEVHAEYSSLAGKIISDPADLRGGCRRINLDEAIYDWDEDGHPYIAMYACWHPCTHKLIRDRNGALVRDPDGRLLRDD